MNSENVDAFAGASYARQARFYEAEGSGIDLAARQAETIDHWRHIRQLECLLPWLKAYPDARWLTVGDGVYGGDAHYLYQQGATVVASDIADTYLAPAKAQGFIPEYAIENCEQLSFTNNSFDFVLCKHSYHHFARPMLALYEMLRVARIGVLLIEPLDTNLICPQQQGLGLALRWAWVAAKNQLKRWLNRKPFYSYGVYELSGNYAYALHERELEKVALGLNYPFVAFRKLCDHYEPALQTQPANANNPFFQSYQNQLLRNEQKARNGYAEFNVLIACIAKLLPPTDLLNQLQQNHWDTRALSRNPYL